jgi:hypothetical protein
MVLVVLLWAGTAQAQNVPVWGQWEHVFSSRTSADPEAGLTADLVAPSGKAFTAAGFWDGGTTWRVRFMPTEAGRWRYRTRSVPAIEGLDGQTGEFLAEPAAATSRFLRHGPIRVSAGGRFFEHADGTPFFWMGDTSWYGGILSARADWDTYLADRAGKRFDVVHFNVVAPRHGVAADENGQISFLPRTEGAPIRMNPRFYQRLDERIAAVNAHGLLAGIVLTWALRSEDSGNSLSEDDLVRVIRYLVARYGAQHVVWILTGDTSYRGADGERWRRIGRAVFGGTQPHAPVTTHPAAMLWPAERFRDEAWFDFVVYQSGHGDNARASRWIHSGPASQRWRDPPPRPLINIEPPYEGHLGYDSRQPHSDYSTRRAIYWSLLTAPTAGVTYGAHGVWSWHTAPGRPPTDHPRTGVAKTWREALSLPGSTQMKHLEEFFTSIPWWRLRPDQKLIVGQPGAGDSRDHIAASRSEEGDLAVIYVPTGGTVRLDPSPLKHGLKAEWFDPRTGSRRPVPGSSSSDLRAPDSQDWVLLLSPR